MARRMVAKEEGITRWRGVVLARGYLGDQPHAAELGGISGDEQAGDGTCRSY